VSESPPPTTTAMPRMIVQKELIAGPIFGSRQDAIDVLEFVARGIVNNHYELNSMSKVIEVSSLRCHS
jgi:D-arabinose 1-dehydrogenase-like Zn-dependent alcohol dehydrogenase